MQLNHTNSLSPSSTAIGLTPDSDINTLTVDPPRVTGAAAIVVPGIIFEDDALVA